MTIYGNFIQPIGDAKTGKIKVGSTPRLVAVDSRKMAGVRNVIVYMPTSSSSATAYVGGRNVTVGTGIPINSGVGMIFPVSASSDGLWMVANTSCEVIVAEFTE